MLNVNTAYKETTKLSLEWIAYIIYIFSTTAFLKAQLLSGQHIDWTFITTQNVVFYHRK